MQKIVVFNDGERKIVNSMKLISNLVIGNSIDIKCDVWKMDLFLNEKYTKFIDVGLNSKTDRSLGIRVDAVIFMIMDIDESILLNSISTLILLVSGDKFEKTKIHVIIHSRIDDLESIKIKLVERYKMQSNLLSSSFPRNFVWKCTDIIEFLLNGNVNVSVHVYENGQEQVLALLLCEFLQGNLDVRFSELLSTGNFPVSKPSKNPIFSIPVQLTQSISKYDVITDHSSNSSNDSTPRTGLLDKIQSSFNDLFKSKSIFRQEFK